MGRPRSVIIGYVREAVGRLNCGWLATGKWQIGSTAGKVSFQAADLAHVICPTQPWEAVLPGKVSGLK